jgi:hypothetical protein
MAVIILIFEERLDWSRKRPRYIRLVENGTQYDTAVSDCRAALAMGIILEKCFCLISS